MADKHSGALVVDKNNEVDADSPSNPERIKPDIGTVAQGVHILGGLGNALTVELGGSVLQIDTGNSVDMAKSMIGGLRKITQDPVSTIAFSHGHLGYNFALGVWLAAAKEAGHDTPNIIAQHNALQLIDQYMQTEPLMKMLLELQMNMDKAIPQLPLARPNATFSDGQTLYGNDREIQLLSAPSETAGAIAAWIPDVEVLYGGPACISLIPNAGMPLWPTGDVRIWADTLDRLARLQAKVLVRSYGTVIRGADEVQSYLSTTARALRFLRSAVIQKLNEGVDLNTALHTIYYPPDLFDHSYLRSTYGSKEDIVRQVWYSITGWWDRNPTNLESVPRQEVANEIAGAISDPRTVIDRAVVLCGEGKHKLALHVIDLLAQADPDACDVAAEARALKANICAQLADESKNFAVKSLYESSSRVLDGKFLDNKVVTGVH